MYLAAARGSGVLVWDASGHSLSPLRGRLGVGAGAGGLGFGDASSSNVVVDVAWRASRTDNSPPWLVAVTPSSACLWDLRQSTSGWSSKPSLRFGGMSHMIMTRQQQQQNRQQQQQQQQTNQFGGGATSAAAMALMTVPNSSTGAMLPSRYVSIACSGRDECGLLDEAGVLRVFDIRMTTDRSSSSSSPFGLGGRGQAGDAFVSCHAFQHGGVGLASLPMSTGDDYWMSWGLDTVDGDAVVKIWDSTPTDGTAKPDHPSSPVEITTATTNDDEVSKAGASLQDATCTLVAQTSLSKLACARVCPSPVSDSIVTLGVSWEGKTNSQSFVWRADLWKLDKQLKTSTSSEASDGGGGLALRKEVSIVSGLEEERNLSSLLGRESQLGMVIASEVTVSSYPGATSSYDQIRDQYVDYGLLLCNLSENGFVTTHAIPEALPRDAHNQDDNYRPLPSEGSQVGVDVPTRSFHVDPESAISDAARIWGKTGDEVTGRALPLEGADGGLANHATVEGSMMPFDMDVPVAYSLTKPGISSAQLGGPNELLIASSGSGGMSSVEEEDDHASSDARGAAVAAMMENIETDRIPCPRLCGATFGSGVGGLAMFHNGDVHRMWKWWEGTRPARIASVPGFVGEGSTMGGSTSLASDIVSSPSGGGGGGGHRAGVTSSNREGCPRTLKDLDDMTAAAKQAQWGGQDRSDVSSVDSAVADMENFFDDSDVSSDSGGEQSMDLTTSSQFQARRQSASSGGQGDDGGRKSSIHSTMPSSHVLSPVVKFSQEHTRLALNNQSIDLAMHLKLSDIDATRAVQYENQGDRGAARDSRSRVPSAHEGRRGIAGSRNDIGSALLGHTDSLERGVHNGEYSIRPNVEESMVFMRKLFSHQQEGGRNVPSLLSPLDSPMLPNSLSSPKQDNVQAPSSREDGGNCSRGDSSLRKLGVYTRKVEKEIWSDDNHFVEMKENCRRNWKVCKARSAQDKAGVWDLLAEVVEGRMNESKKSFDGWGGMGGGALGSGVVDRLLAYYESLGDVQMLATIVCVLRGRVRAGAGSDFFLLNPAKDYKYDTYIRRYADLLYGWGLLTKRAELNKHLVNSTATATSSWACQLKNNDATDASVVALSFTCPRCRREPTDDSDNGANFCKTCRTPAFRCVICDNAVRGLSTCCPRCGHGGHVKHMKEWFSTHDTCPSGCGCRCALSPPAVSTV